MTATLAHALTAHREGRLDEARAGYDAVLRLDARQVDALSLLGALSIQTGDLDRAIGLLQQAISVDATLPGVHYNLALALQGRQRFDAALVHYDRALTLAPDHLDARNNRGQVLGALKQHARAVADFDAVIARDPQHLRAHANRGNTLRALGRLDESVDSCNHALAIDPNDAAARNNRGAALHAMRRLAAALQDFDAAIARDPTDAQVHVNRAIVLCEMGRPDEALASTGRAIKLQPGHVQAHTTTGDALLALGRLEGARDAYARVLAIEPRTDVVPGLLLHTKARLCDWTGIDTSIVDIANGLREGRAMTPPWPWLASCDDPGLQRLSAEAWVRQRIVADRHMPTFAPPSTRIRLAYVGATFHDHATTYLLADLFERHDRRRFEVTAFSFGRPRDDAMRRRAVAAFDRFVDVSGHADAEAAEMARELGIDIAIDLNALSEEPRAAILACRAAPVQASLMAYPATTGAAWMDYIVADRHTLPAVDFDHYSERVVHLPDCGFTCDPTRPISGAPVSRATLGLPASGFVYCCFSSSHKIRPATFDSWMRILGAVDGSVLWLIDDASGAAANLRREAGARGIAGDRLVFAPRIDSPAHLARHRAADLFLDTLPYNAHTTALDALWAGLPLLTCRGGSFPGRVASSLLQAVDMAALVAETPEQYEATAIAIGRQPVLAAKHRSDLAARRLTTPLFDAALYAGHLEAAFEAMHARRVAGLPPAHIVVSPGARAADMLEGTRRSPSP